LATQLLRGLGSDNIDSRLRHAEFAQAGDKVRWLGMPIAALSQLQSVLVVGSYLRKDHPLFAARIRAAQRQGGQVFSVNSQVRDWAMPKTDITAPAAQWTAALAQIAAAVAQAKGIAAPVTAQADDAAKAVAASLLQGERKGVLLGNAAAHHAQADALLALANWIAEQTGASVGYLTEAANTLGAQWVGAMPQASGKNAGQMMAGAGSNMRAMLLLNVEPEFDTAAAQPVEADMVVTLSPFKANMAFSDVLLPIAPFTETAGTFVNAEGRVQSFHGVVKPLGDTRPAWKVLRALGNILGLQEGAFAANAAEDVLASTGLQVGEKTTSSRYNNKSCSGSFDGLNAQNDMQEPCSAAIYQLDSVVRRAPSLQATRDGRLGQLGRKEAA
jgi:NADH-quinone oxidoreductase subunit G